MAVSVASREALGSRARRAADSFAALFTYGNKYGAAVAYALAALAVAIGWFGRDTRNLVAGEGLGYWLGIVGGVAMALVPLYSARKRSRALDWLGPIRHWFQAHMGLGIFGPLIILYHSNFQLGDMNSRIALYCALLVAGSGIVGRYLYGKIHLGLYGRRATLTDLTTRVRESLDRTDNDLFRPLYEQLAVIDRDVIHDAESLGAAALRPVALAWKTRVTSWRLNREIVARLADAARSSPTVAKQRLRLEHLAKGYVRDHLRQVRAVALFGFYERAFYVWHFIHVPFFFMLILSAIVHIVAVHMY
jgi:hypothetical protein